MFDKSTRDSIRAMARKLGDTLYAHGYSGVFCVDFLVENGSGEVYLGEINPRISGASPLTNLLTSKYGGVPLFLFHLLEFLDVDWEVDLKKMQKRWETYDEWSQLVLKQTDDAVEKITRAPSSGLWQMREDGTIEFVRLVTTWHTVGHDDEAFYLRVYGTDEYRYKGGDLGVIVTRGRMQTDDRQLTDRADAPDPHRGVPFHHPALVRGRHGDGRHPGLHLFVEQLHVRAGALRRQNQDPPGGHFRLRLLRQH